MSTHPLGSPKPNTLLGIALMLLAMLCFPFLDVLAKKLGQQGLPVMEAVWARMFLGALLTAPLLWLLEGKERLVPRDNMFNGIRGFCILLTTFFFFGAMKFQGIAETLSLYFVQPILVTALAPLILREKVGLRRWLAVLVGFAGVLVIIRPGIITIGPGSGLALFAGLAAAFVILLSRKLAGLNSALANTFYTSLLGAVMASIVVSWQWQWPTPQQWAMMFGLAAIGTTCNYLIIKAFEWCEASLLAPLGYAEMINAVLAGWYFFGDFPDGWTFVGVAILIACATYISYREHNQSPSPDDASAQI